MLITETLNIGGYEMLLRDCARSDMAQLLSLHRRVFGSEVDARWYDWKYGHGAGEAVGIWHDGSLIAHCGGFPRDLFHRGSLCHDIQFGDVMVAPEWRGLLTRRGPFFHVSKAMYASRLGAGNRFYAGFGFPNARALGLGVRSGLTRGNGIMTAISWACAQDVGKPHASLSRWLWRVSATSPESLGFDSAIEHAWSLMRSSTQNVSVGKRDAAYVRWRFAMRPDHKAIFLQLGRPWSKLPLGVAVLAENSDEQKLMHWLDWIGPPDLMPTACFMCLAEAHRRGAAGVKAWASDSVLRELSGTGISDQSEVAVISLANASAMSAEADVQLNWWFMGGDTDFL